MSPAIDVFADKLYLCNGLMALNKTWAIAGVFQMSYES